MVGGRVEKSPWSKRARTTVMLDRQIWSEQKSITHTMAIRSFIHRANTYGVLTMSQALSLALRNQHRGLPLLDHAPYFLPAAGPTVRLVFSYFGF